MLHILDENNDLKNRVFPLPDGVRKILKKTLSDYKGDKTIDGYKRLNNLLGMENITYQEMKRIKNFFDNYKGTDKSYEYILNGGDAMKTWVNNTLNTATKVVHDFKQAKKDAGISNAFIRSHEKNRQTKKKNKPTQAKFVTNNVSHNIIDGTSLKYESIIKPQSKVFVINEEQRDILKEAMDDSFSLEELSRLKSFSARLNYCKAHLGQPIGKGSSRATFQIDDQKVLKLAWNEKGIAQNVEEERAYGDDIFPQVYDSDEEDLWIISEFVLPAEAKDFQHCFGITFQKFQEFIRASAKYRFGQNRGYTSMSEEEYCELLENNEDLYSFDEYIGNYGAIVTGDMVRIVNYGLTQRNGEPHIVLLDAGLTDYVWRTYYRRR